MRFDLPNELTIRACGTDWKFNASGISNETACQLVLQGLAVICQRANAGLSDEPLANQHGRVREKLTSIEKNEYSFGSGGGGKRLTDLEREMRVIAEQELVDVCRMKLTDARKLVAESIDKAVGRVMGYKVAASGKSFTDEQLDGLTSRKFAAWESAAKAAIAARAAAVSGDEDLDLS
jgi:hypothetical protein